MLCNFVRAKSLNELCFSANNLLDFREAAFAKGSNILMSDKDMPIGKAQPLSNTGIERMPVITTVAINPVPTAFEIVAKRLIFS